MSSYSQAGILGMHPKPLSDRTVFIPRMPTANSRAVAAAFRGHGIRAKITPASDSRTLELGQAHSSGEECYPEIITLGDFLRVLVDDGFAPSDVAFLMPTSSGPCRFGQYAHYIRVVLDRNGFGDALIISPTSSDAYEGMGDGSKGLNRSTWWGIVSADLLTAQLLRTRPYEMQRGKSDECFEEALSRVCAVLENPARTGELSAVADALRWGRDRLRSVEKRDETRPLIGVVGEIFCRNNEFTNMAFIRLLEGHGAEAWLTGLREWIHYSNREDELRLRRKKSLVSPERLRSRVRHWVQEGDAAKLEEIFSVDLRDRPEPTHMKDLLTLGEPYLPSDGALGEMVLSVSRVVYLHHHGVSGVVDISPFTCMNAIVAEAIYPTLTRDLDGLPIRTFYFDGTQGTLDRDIGVFLELARSYERLRALAGSTAESAVGLVGT